MCWHVYKKDDPNTYPKLDCPILIYDDAWCEFYICKWNHTINKFFEPKEKLLHTWKECYYQYIGYVPDGYKTLQPNKCMAELQERCELEDDGYCMDVHKPCPFRKTVNEYSLKDNKRIWKEFE